MDYLQIEKQKRNRIFWDWFNQEYLYFRSLDKRNNASEFAKYIPMNQATVNAFLNETRGIPTSAKIQRALINRFGQKAAEAMGKNIDEIYESIDISEVPADLRNRFLKATEEINNALRERSLDADSPEGHAIIKSVYGKFGLSVSITESKVTNENSG